MRAVVVIAVMVMGGCGSEEPKPYGRVTLKVQWVFDYTTCPGGKPLKGPSRLPVEATYEFGLHQYRESWLEGKCIKSQASSYDVTPHSIDAWMHESQAVCAPMCESAWHLVCLP